jgi:hypothetical protein
VAVPGWAARGGTFASLLRYVRQYRAWATVAGNVTAPAGAAAPGQAEDVEEIRFHWQDATMQRG